MGKPPLPEAAPWLVAIDLQHAFADSDSPWFAPTLAQTKPAIASLVPRFGERVVFTRFVPPAEPEGSWRRYYKQWSFAEGTRGSPLWDVIPPWTDRLTVSSHTFSKWVPDLARITGPHPAIVLCGVSTDCCVLATAFAAVDAGAQVRVVADACAAKTPEIHAAALAMMEARAPQLEIVSAAEELARR
jgi:nicotinamidase-related amidase